MHLQFFIAAIVLTHQFYGRAAYGCTVHCSLVGWLSVGSPNKLAMDPSTNDEKEPPDIPVNSATIAAGSPATAENHIAGIYDLESDDFKNVSDRMVFSEEDSSNDIEAAT